MAFPNFSTLSLVALKITEVPEKGLAVLVGFALLLAGGMDVVRSFEIKTRGSETSWRFTRVTGIIEMLGYADVDLERVKRTGVPEIIYGEGKNAAEIEGIINVLLDAGQSPVMVTRLSEVWNCSSKTIPEGDSTWTFTPR